MSTEIDALAGAATLDGSERVAVKQSSGAVKLTLSTLVKQVLALASNVGIGTTTGTPGARLHVKTTADEVLRLESTGNTYLSFFVSAVRKAYLQFSSATLTIFNDATSGIIRFGFNGAIYPLSLISTGEGVWTGTGTVRTLQLENTGGATKDVLGLWNKATSGDNLLAQFYTEASPASRGTIDYNRAGGLIRYNTTSDYRAKDVSAGALTGSGAIIDGITVYWGRMTGATESRPMFVAHEVADGGAGYAVSGAKDAVDDQGQPVYQSLDASALVPVLWAEVQSLRARVAALEA